MATANPFDLLGDDDAEDPSLLAAAAKKAAPPPQAAKPPPAPATAKLPSKPPPPAQAVREARSEGSRGGGRAGGRGGGRARGGYNRDFAPSEHSGYSAPGQGAPEDGDAKRETEGRGPRGGYRGGGRRVSFSNGEGDDVERPRRDFERRSGTGRGNEIKREGSGRGNWGTRADEHAQVTEQVVAYGEKNLGDDKALDQEAATKDPPNAEPEEKEPEDKEMTLEEYEKVLEEKRKALQALKTEERKVDSKAFQSMQQLSNKKDNDDIFVKLGSEKDKRKEALEKDEKSKKAVSINEFLKPAEGERYYSPGGRGRGRGRGRGGDAREYGGGARGYGGRDSTSSATAPAIGDPGQFPTLGGK